jgi:hypothetical protein
MQEKYAKNAKKHGLSMHYALLTHANSEGWLLFTPSALRKEASPCFS